MMPLLLLLALFLLPVPAQATVVTYQAHFPGAHVTVNQCDAVNCEAHAGSGFQLATLRRLQL